MEKTRRYTTQDPFMIGFDALLNKFPNGFNKPSTNYPPYNIIKASPEDGVDEKYLVEIAVAGFDREDVKVSLDHSTLRVEGSIPEGHDDCTFIHKGIASRSFVREFEIAENIKADDVKM